MIILYGDLRKKFGEKINADVRSVKELMKAAEANRPGFSSHIQRNRNYVIKRGNEFRSAEAVDENEVEMRFSETTWHVLPMPMGYSGVTRVIIGAVLVVVGAVLTYTGVGSGIGVPMMKWGAAIAFSGVASMLAPSPSISSYSDRESPDERPSYLFNGPTNRVAAGGAVPLAFGFNIDVGSTFLSGGLEIGDIA